MNLLNKLEELIKILTNITDSKSVSRRFLSEIICFGKYIDAFNKACSYKLLI